MVHLSAYFASNGAKLTLSYLPIFIALCWIRYTEPFTYYDLHIFTHTITQCNFVPGCWSCWSLGCFGLHSLSPCVGDGADLFTGIARNKPMQIMKVINLSNSYTACLWGMYFISNWIVLCTQKLNCIARQQTNIHYNDLYVLKAGVCRMSRQNKRTIYIYIRSVCHNIFNIEKICFPDSCWGTGRGKKLCRLVQQFYKAKVQFCPWCLNSCSLQQQRHILNDLLPQPERCLW